MMIRNHSLITKLDHWIGRYFNIMALIRTVGVVFFIFWSMIGCSVTETTTVPTTSVEGAELRKIGHAELEKLWTELYIEAMVDTIHPEDTRLTPWQTHKVHYFPRGGTIYSDNCPYCRKRLLDLIPPYTGGER